MTYGPRLLNGGTVDTNYMRKRKPAMLGMDYAVSADPMLQDMTQQAPDQAKYLQLQEELQALENPTETKTGPTPEEIEMALKMAAQAAGGNSLPTGPFSTSPSLARQRAMAGFGRSFGR